MLRTCAVKQHLTCLSYLLANLIDKWFIIQCTDPLSDSQSRHPSPHTTGEGSEGDRIAVRGDMPQTQALAPIPSIEVRTIGALDEMQKFNLSGDFADMLSDIVPLLARAVSADDLKDYLRRYRHPTSKRPYLDSSLYNKCTSTKEILNVLQDHCYIHPTQVCLLRRIVQKYGCDECKRLLQEYEAKIPMTAPVKRRRDFPSDADTDTSRSTKKVKVTVEGNPDTCSLQDVENIKSAVEEATGISSDVIVLIQSEPGSVVLTFLVPASTSEYFVNISKDDISLAWSGILKIEIDDTVIEIQVQMPPTHKTEVESTSQMLEELSISEKEHVPPVKSQLRPWPGVDPLKKTTPLHTSVEEYPLSDPPYTHGTAEEPSPTSLDPFVKMDSAAWAKENLRFRFLVVDVADQLSEQDRESLVSIYDLPSSYRQESSLVVLAQLEMLRAFSPSAPMKLVELLKSLRREDLAKNVVKSQLRPWPGVDPLKKTTLPHTSVEEHPLSDPPYTHGTAEEPSPTSLDPFVKMDSAAWAKENRFRFLVADVAQQLNEQDRESLVYIYGLPSSYRRESSLVVLAQLEMLGAFSPSAPMKLVELLKSLRREDLAKDAEKRIKKDMKEMKKKTKYYQSGKTP